MERWCGGGGLPSPLAGAEEPGGGVDGLVGGVWRPVEHEGSSRPSTLLDEGYALLDEHLGEVRLTGGRVNLEVVVVPANTHTHTHNGQIDKLGAGL